MIYRLAADLILIFHLAFVLFILLGGLLVLRAAKVMWLHLAALLWGVVVELFGLVCPLTPLETTLRRLGGEPGYQGDFIAHYISAILYPSGLNPEIQVWLALAALLPNVLIYSYILRRKIGFGHDLGRRH